MDNLQLSDIFEIMAFLLENISPAAKSWLD